MRLLVHTQHLWALAATVCRRLAFKPRGSQRETANKQITGRRPVDTQGPKGPCHGLPTCKGPPADLGLLFHQGLAPWSLELIPLPSAASGTLALCPGSCHSLWGCPSLFSPCPLLCPLSTPASGPGPTGKPAMEPHTGPRHLLLGPPAALLLCVWCNSSCGVPGPDKQAGPPPPNP